MPITLVVRFKVRKGMEARAREELSRLVPQSRKDKGCIRYDLLQGADEKTAFLFYERWESAGDLDAHKAMPYMKAFADRSKGLFDGPVEATFWEEVSA